ncbi:olfactory receptor 52L1-like [Menidia menidia]
MDNISVSLDVLTLEGLKVSPGGVPAAFALLLLLYCFVLLSNGGVFLLVLGSPPLRSPMLLLSCHLGLNDALGASVIVPRLLADLLTPPPRRRIGYAACALQAFGAHVYASAAHTLLMAMAWDRYLAVCRPLQYAALMTAGAVRRLAAGAWAAAALLVAALVGLSVRLSRCRTHVANPFCDNASLFKLSCESVLVNNAFGLAYTALLLGASLGCITLTYLRIAAAACRRPEAGGRALRTCASHLLLYLLMFVSGAIIIVLHRFPHLSDYRKLASILFHVVPPALNASIYGLQIKAVRQRIVLVFTRNAGTANN